MHLWLVPSPGAGSRVCIDGSFPLLGPGATYASMARPVIRAWSLIGHKCQSRSCGPVAASTALARPVRHGPGAASAELARPVHRARSRSETGHFCAGPLVSVCLALISRHFCAGRSPYDGPALTTRGRHAPTARPALLGPGAVSGTGHFCAGHMIPVCLALTLRWAETLPLLRWAPYLWRAVPYFALVPRARSLARPVPRARSLDIALRGRDLPFYDGRVISLHMRPSGPRGQACPSALSANPAG